MQMVRQMKMLVHKQKQILTTGVHLMLQRFLKMSSPVVHVVQLCEAYICCVIWLLVHSSCFKMSPAKLLTHHETVLCDEGMGWKDFLAGLSPHQRPSHCHGSQEN